MQVVGNQATSTAQLGQFGNDLGATHVASHVLA